MPGSHCDSIVYIPSCCSLSSTLDHLIFSPDQQQRKYLVIKIQKLANIQYAIKLIMYSSDTHFEQANMTWRLLSPPQNNNNKKML